MCVSSISICLMSWACSAVHVCTPRVRKTKFFAGFSIPVKFDCYATLYKSLSAWVEALKA